MRRRATGRTGSGQAARWRCGVEDFIRSRYSIVYSLIVGLRVYDLSVCVTFDLNMCQTIGLF